MSAIRLRRLQSDHERLREYLQRQPRVRLIQAEGHPPERYQLEYQIRSLRQMDDQLQVVASHLVEIFLPVQYPRLPPQCRMLTPIFHPNIAPHAICIGDHWSAGEPLWSMVARIGEMIAYQSYNTKSPLNGEAARWVDENQDKLPLDRAVMFVEPREAEVRSRPPAVPIVPALRPLAGDEDRPASGVRGPREDSPSPRPAPAGGEGEAAVTVICPDCQARYRVPRGLASRRFRCKKCQAILEIPPEAVGP
jgi:ubiquitin-protein ligase